MPLNNFRQIHMPYCLKKQDDGCYVVLNREYKPLGFDTDEYLKYEDYPILVKYKITKAKIKQLSVHPEDNSEDFYLYNDGCLPEHNKKNMDAYLEKLRILTKLEKKD